MDNNPIELIYAIATVVTSYVLFARMKACEARLTRLENQRAKPEPKAPEKPKSGFAWEKPVDNFNPAKVETLRPNQVRGREVDQNVFEFDSKL